MTAEVLLALYGAIVISSVLLVASMGRLATKELLRVGGYGAVRSIYFWLALNLAVQGAALVCICGFRTIDAFRGHSTGASWGGWIVMGFVLLLASNMGFNWAGTLELRRGRMIWWGYVGCLALWGIVVATTQAFRT